MSRAHIALAAGVLLGVSPLALQAQSGMPSVFSVLRLVPLSPGEIRLRSLRLGGAVTQEFRLGKSTGTATSASSHSMLNAQLSGSGYYWQPWFARVSAELGASVGATKPITGDDREVQATGSDHVGASVTLFPVSQFPLTISFRASENHDGAVPLRGVTRNKVRFEVDQAYNPQHNNNRYRVRYVRQRFGYLRGGISDSETINDSVNATGVIGLAKWNRLELKANLLRTEETASGRTQYSSVISAANQFDPATDLHVSSNASLTDSRIYSPESGGETQIDVALLSSSARWNPTGKPYRASASARLGATRSEVNNSVARNLYSDITAGGSYDIYRTRTTSVIADATVSRRASGGEVDWQLSSRQGVNWNHMMPSGTWRGFRYNARFSAGANNRLDDDGRNAATARAGGSQGVSRSWMGQAGLFSWTASHSSSLSQNSSTDGTYALGASLSHAASLAWRGVRRHRSANVTLSVSDSRDYTLLDQDEYSGLEDGRQRLDLDLEYRMGMGLHGELTSGYRLDGSRVTTRDSDGGFGIGSELYASYRTPGLFGNGRLDYSSTLSIRSQELVPMSLGDEGDQLAWRHSLNYRIGRLTSTFGATLTREQGRYDFNANLRIERRFGR